MATAEVLIEELRESDFICRPGGDDFIVLLSDSDVESARIVAGKLIRSMRASSGRARRWGDRAAPSIGISASDTGGWMAPHELTLHGRRKSALEQPGRSQARKSGA